METLDFSRLTDAQQLLRYLALPSDFLDPFQSTAYRLFYQPMDIPKRSRRGYRRVYKVTHRLLANAQKQIATAVAVATRRTVSGCTHGFVRGRSTVSNAARHLGAAVVLRTDIRDFFDSITAAPIAVGFGCLGAAPAAARALTQLVTLDGHLVQGPSSSPAIANLICLPIDTQLEALASENSAVYTRYADDLTFSGPRLPELAAIVAVVSQHGFQLATEKTRYQHRGRYQYVTGLCVTDAAQPRAPRKLKRWLRSVVHAAGRHGINEIVAWLDNPYHQNAEIARIDGSIAYLYSVEPQFAARLDRIWQPALDACGRGFSLRRESLYREPWGG